MKNDELEKNLNSSTHSHSVNCNVIRLVFRRWSHTLRVILVKLFGLPIKLWNWTVNYAGFAAEFVKVIPIVIEALIISYPILTYVYILNWSQTLAGTWQLLILMLWLVQFPIIFIIIAWIEYKRKS